MVDQISAAAAGAVAHVVKGASDEGTKVTGGSNLSPSRPERGRSRGELG